MGSVLLCDLLEDNQPKFIWHFWDCFRCTRRLYDWHCSSCRCKMRLCHTIHFSGKEKARVVTTSSTIEGRTHNDQWKEQRCMHGLWHTLLCKQDRSTDVRIEGRGKQQRSHKPSYSCRIPQKFGIPEKLKIRLSSCSLSLSEKPL